MKTITAILCAVLVALPIQRPQAQLAPAVCIVLFAAAAVGGVCVMISNCRPKYYCCQDSETGQHWCRVLTRGEAAAADLKVLSGPYNDASLCNTACSNTVATVAGLYGTIIHIEKSTNLVNWIEAAAFDGNPNDFYWSETNKIQSAFFYRVRVE